MPQVPSWQQSECARDDAGADVEPLHGFSMTQVVALTQVQKSLEQADQCDWYEQVNEGVAIPIGQVEVSDEYRAQRGTNHAGDPCITQGAV